MLPFFLPGVGLGVGTDPGPNQGCPSSWDPEGRGGRGWEEAATAWNRSGPDPLASHLAGSGSGSRRAKMTHKNRIVLDFPFWGLKASPVALVIKTLNPNWPKMLDPDPQKNQCGSETLLDVGGGGPSCHRLAIFDQKKIYKKFSAVFFSRKLTDPEHSRNIAWT